MAAGYEKMRDEFIKQGLSRDAAQAKAAAIWNSHHADSRVTGKVHKKKKGAKK